MRWLVVKNLFTQILSFLGRISIGAVSVKTWEVDLEWQTRYPDDWRHEPAPCLVFTVLSGGYEESCLLRYNAV
jgi:hypothetical protein